ncbi:serine hydrolase [Streptococcus sp. zg-JUN1979]|uniref:serine hydrolase n=1 Tax=Streptococcus sp. zg-JUN1979 TaxID=3391450 RepID=UPI0039A4BC81
MKKLTAIILAAVLFFPVTVDSTEVEGELSETLKEELTNTAATQLMYFTSIPQKPRLATSTLTYSDSSLTQQLGTLPKDSSLRISEILVNEQGIYVFRLADGAYIEASREAIYEDVVETLEMEATFWLKDRFVLYQAPYQIGVKPQETKLTAGDKVRVVAKAKTHYGTYYKLDVGSWVLDSDVSSTDTRMLKVQKYLTEKYNKDNYSIYVKQLDTQTIAGINMDKSMYSASIAKLAELYITQQKLNNGEISLSDTLRYIPDVNTFDGAYDPSGSGHLPKKADNKDYSVGDLIKMTAKHSDNVAANMLGYYITNQYDTAFYSQVTSIMGQSWNMKDRSFSAHSAGNLMEAIYYQDGDIISYLSDTDFDDNRISKNISVPVAHKIGDAYDYKHDVAIVYAEHPFILSIFTDKASYEDITKIADDIYAILK